ncbi:hypothetical protein ACE939_00770 [Aquimarina sp. W85]|uniref:hypothetical protein n=1 Tax=Aquimarina rhodophyticola TaxID=3342246 RepID=UPI00366BD9BD
MQKETILREMEVLTGVINANRGLFGNERMVEKCNKKIDKLIVELEHFQKLQSWSFGNGGLRNIF